MIMKSLFVLTFFIPGIWASVYERKLVEDLLSSRQKRPLNFNRTTDVSTIDKITFNFRLVEVLKLSAKEQVLDTSAWIEQSWIDTSLAWDEAEYGGIDEVTIDYRSIWVPDTVLLNNADSTTMGNSVNKGNDVMISSNGEVRWLAPLVFRSSCKLNVRFFPFDEQFCALEFASWSSINLKIEPGKRRILKNYTESSEWILRGVAVGQVNLKNTNKTAVVYIINIRRQFFYYVLYLITPCLLVSMMATVLFVLPPESGELMVVGVTLLLSLTVFFLLASTHIPETSEVVPLIGRYYSLTIIQISCCLVLSCAVLRMHQASFGTVSAWYRRFVFRHLAKIVRVTVPQEFLRNDGQVAAETTAENAPKSSSGLQRLADRLKRKEASDKQQGEWQLAARIFNKLFLFVYMLVVALTIAGIFLQIPQLFENESDYSLATFDGYSTRNVLSKNRLEVHKNA